MRHGTSTHVQFDAPRACGGGTAVMRPLSFWLYVAAGVVLIIASAIALPFVSARALPRD